MHPGTGGPFWSLSSEAAYYAAFAFLVFARGWVRIVALILILLIAGPLTIALAPLWMLGGATQRLLMKSPSFWSGRLLLASGLVIWVGYEVLSRKTGRLHVAWSTRPEILQDYLVGFCFALTVAGVALSVNIHRPWLLRFQRPIRWFSDSTFTLYLLHFPAMLLVAALVGAYRTTLAGQLTVLVGTFAICVFSAELGERRKLFWRNLLAPLVIQSRITPPPPAPAGKQSLSTPALAVGTPPA